MSIIAPELDWKQFKGTGRKPHFFMCKFCSQIIYLEDSKSWGHACLNCEHTKWFGNLWLPIILSTVVNWLLITTGWFKEELIAQMLESGISKHKKVGGLLYHYLFEKGAFKWK